MLRKFYAFFRYFYTKVYGAKSYLVAHQDIYGLLLNIFFENSKEKKKKQIVHDFLIFFSDNFKFLRLNFDFGICPKLLQKFDRIQVALIIKIHFIEIVILCCRFPAW